MICHINSTPVRLEGHRTPGGSTWHSTAVKASHRQPHYHSFISTPDT